MIVGIELGAWETPVESENRFASLKWIAGIAASSGFDLLAMPAQTWVGRAPALQPLETLSALAETCESTFLTGPLLIAVAHPVDTGEQIATVHHAVEGRLIVEVQTVADPTDLAAFQIAPTEVAPRTRESIEVWRKIWFDEFVDHAGTFYKVPGAQPTLRLPGGDAPAIALSVHSEANLEMAAALHAGLSMASDSTHHASWSAIATVRSRRLPVVMRTPIETAVGVDATIAAYAAAGVDYLVLQPRATTSAEVINLIRECGEYLEH